MRRGGQGRGACPYGEEDGFTPRRIFDRPSAAGMTGLKGVGGVGNDGGEGEGVAKGRSGRFANRPYGGGDGFAAT